jgi:phenylpropionate dioxygenase-like ring-hydroxylating dioxygenase large terminal subunit
MSHAARSDRPLYARNQHLQPCQNRYGADPDRRVFFADDIYETELERIFAHAWNFMCHESQIPNSGDFFLNIIGADSVIATRDR